MARAASPYELRSPAGASVAIPEEDRVKIVEAFSPLRVWTDAEVFALNASQHRGDIHPYTCGNDSNHRPLIATPQGWRCADCDYTQGWAHGVGKGPPCQTTK